MIKACLDAFALHDFTNKTPVIELLISILDVTDQNLNVAIGPAIEKPDFDSSSVIFIDAAHDAF